MFRFFLDDIFDFLSFWNSILDYLINRMCMRNIVHFSDIISLFEYEMSIVQYICDDSMTFHINFYDAFHIHEFDVIDQEEARMDKNNRMITHEHDSSIIINSIQNELKKNIIDSQKKNRKYDEIAKIRWEDSAILGKNPNKKSEWNKKKYEF